MASVYINHRRKRLTSLPLSDPKVKAFHESLPHYRPTPLVPLPEIAQQLGIRSLLLKDESSRLGLPAFKILGASWATAKSVAKRTGLEGELSLGNLASAAQAENLVLYAATDGNHGRKNSGFLRQLSSDLY